MTKCNNRLFPRFVIKMNLLKFIANVLFLKKNGRIQNIL